jgi:hypothetical protein
MTRAFISPSHKVSKMVILALASLSFHHPMYVHIFHLVNPFWFLSCPMSNNLAWWALERCFYC